MTDRTVRAIATDQELADKFELVPIFFDSCSYVIIVLRGGDQRCVVFHASASSLQFLSEQFFCDVLRNHSDERVRTLFRFKSHVSQLAIVRNHSYRRNTICCCKKWFGQPG